MSAGIRREDAGQLVRYLCWRARVPAPRVDWHGRSVRGSYLSAGGRRGGRVGAIKIGPRIRTGLAGVIHEVAHHVVSRRQPLTRKQRRRVIYQRGHSHHGGGFTEVLIELAGYWYGDPAGYPWGSEYRTVAAGARRELGRDES